MPYVDTFTQRNNRARKAEEAARNATELEIIEAIPIPRIDLKSSIKVKMKEE